MARPISGGRLVAPGLVGLEQRLHLQRTRRAGGCLRGLRAEEGGRNEDGGNDAQHAHYSIRRRATTAASECTPCFRGRGSARGECRGICACSPCVCARCSCSGLSQPTPTPPPPLPSSASSPGLLNI